MRLVTSVLVAAGLALGAQTATAASYFNPHAFYNCTSGTPTGYVYINSFQFGPGNSYAEGYQHNNKLAGQIQSGRYALRGNKIIGLSGPLKRHHESFLIQRYDLALLIAGRLTGVGCRNPQYSPPTTTTTTTTPSVPAFPVGQYTCYDTVQNLDGSYQTRPMGNDYYWSDGTYLRSGSIRGDGWHQNGYSIVFTGGAYWTNYAHDVGTWYPSGVAMPHAQGATASMLFTLVIKDTTQEGGTPPSQEFVTNDDPSSGSSIPMSFNYCAKTG